MNAHAGMNQAFIATLITLTSSKILGLNQARGPEPGKLNYKLYIFRNEATFGRKDPNCDFVSYRAR